MTRIGKIFKLLTLLRFLVINTPCISDLLLVLAGAVMVLIISEFVKVALTIMIKDMVLIIGDAINVIMISVELAHN